MITDVVTRFDPPPEIVKPADAKEVAESNKTRQSYKVAQRKSGFATSDRIPSPTR